MLHVYVRKFDLTDIAQTLLETKRPLTPLLCCVPSAILHQLADLQIVQTVQAHIPPCLV